ncbi:MAG: sortase, partial [Actinomycetota bacterium]|nr:sortase [Actinomycetota bacterium]
PPEITVVQPVVAKVAPRRARSRSVSVVARRGALALGVCVVAFLAFGLWFAGLTHARSQVGLQRRFNAELTNAAAPIGGAIAPGSPVAIVEITRIGVHEVVVEGARSTQLREGPGHVVGSSLPGQPGNAVIAGRKTLYGGPFAHLGSLRTGDMIRATTGQGVSTYRVLGVDKVKAEDGSVFADHGDDRLTLVTSNSSVDASGRLVVSARLVGKAFEAQAMRRTLDSAGLGLTGERDAISSVLVWLELLVALTLIGVFALTRWSRLAAWIVFAPGIALFGWLVFENAVRLLPATL